MLELQGGLRSKVSAEGSHAGSSFMRAWLVMGIGHVCMRIGESVFNLENTSAETERFAASSASLDARGRLDRLSPILKPRRLS